MKRSYKLQEFTAHASSVNCLKIGRKSSGVLVTGGDDKKVNIWAIGKPNAILSLTGHQSPVTCVEFDAAEETVAAGAAGGTVKLWDLEEAKVVRTLTGHRSHCLSLDFHPYSDYLATGSLDTNLKIWDLRQKSCLHTYKGHTKDVTHVRFSPDGRWVTSGSADGTVKLWDLTAGKMLHNITTHTHPINAVEFHPNEFLMVTASMDRTCRFWDLETFELVDTVGPEALPSKAVLFDESGSHMLSATQDGMRVYSWEPVQMLDFVDVGWSKISDLSLHENKLIGCSFHQTFVGVWVVDLTRVAPFGSAPVDRASLNSSPQTELVNRLSRPKPTTAEGRQQQQQRQMSDASAGVNSSSSSRSSPAEEQQQQQQQRASSSPAARVPSGGDLSLRAAAVASSSSSSSTPSQQQQNNNNNHQEDARRPQPYGTNATSTSTSRPASAAGQQQQQQQRAPPPQTVSVGTGIGDSLPLSGLDFDKLGVGGRGRRGSASSSSGAAAAAPAVSRQMSGPQPQNLDMEAFLPSEVPASDLLDEAVLGEVMGKHTTMSQILSTRSSNLAVVQRLWAKGDVRGAVAALRRCKDSSVAADVMGAIGHQREAADLEFLQLAGPVLLELLEATHEQWQTVAVEAALAFAKRFGQVIRDTLGAAVGGIGTDMAAEARRDKCMASKNALQALVPRLQDVQGSPGDLGRKSRALLEEIQAL